MSAASPPLFIDSIDAAVEQVLARIAGPIVLGIPLGVGKPNPLVNALYRRIQADATRQLRIVTALSLEKPVGKSELEVNFLGPLVERVFGDYPDLLYLKDVRAGTLPANIQVSEFFFKTGDYLGNAGAQQHYISTNYTFVARDMVLQGVNLVAQAVATRGAGATQRLSLSSNPDVVLELVELMRAARRPLLTVGVINHQLPFMPNGAEVAPGFFDIVVTDPAATHTVFAPPNNKVSRADYAIGLHAASLVEDGGTLQIGIGALGDAIAQALIVRERHGDDYRRLMQTLCPDGLAGRSLGRFEQGLYGCSEMFVNGLLRLIDAGIVRREVYADAVLQQLVNSGQIVAGAVTPATLRALLDAGRVRSPLDAHDLAFLQHYGVLDASVSIDGEHLVRGTLRVANDLHSAEGLARVAATLLGERLARGHFMSGGFFLGPRDFYARLRSLPAQTLAQIDMTRIDFINQLHGQEALKRAQRRQARFINTTMMVTLLGAACSDALESGQVVSGVGGQYNFVAMAHALPDARLLMLLRATHDNREGLRSGIVWNYGNVTIPRHLRDIVITEYGVADLRGQCDSEVIQRLIAVADARFQDELVAQAKAHGKLEPGYRVPDRYRANLPQALEEKLKPWAATGLLPDFPFGTDLNDDELRIVRALKRLQHATRHPGALAALALRGLWHGKPAPPAYLQRLGLDKAGGLKHWILRRLLASSLSAG